MRIKLLDILRSSQTMMVIFLLFCLSINAQQPTDNGRDEKAIQDAAQNWWTASMKTHDQRIAWWREAKFGCFIHWGVYSTFGGEWKGKPFRGYAEHLMRIQKIPVAEYKEKAVSVFNPVKFNAEEWVKIIKAAGMKYVIITAKHHDGFAMYPSAVTRYNIYDATPFKRDPMRELADACRKNGIRFGFYYSHAIDWGEANGTGNDWDYENPSGARALHGGVQWYDLHPELLAKVQKNYVDQKAIPQIKELIKNYKPDILWFDTPSRLPLSENIRILKAVRETDPNVVVNGRLARGRGYSFGDYINTSDRAAEFFPTEGDWESIPTTNESYGYHKHDNSHKPVSHFVQLMAKAAARGGSILLNIGPTGDGLIDTKDQEILEGIGKWLAVNGKSVYGSERTPLSVQAWGESTRKGNNLYLHVFNLPTDGKLVVGGLKSQISKAYLLADAQKKPLKVERLNNDDVVINITVKSNDSPDVVAVVEVKGEIKTNPVRLLTNNKEQTNLLHVFDGALYGKGLRYGDGKAPRAYIYDWKELTQSVGWKARLNQPAEFDVEVKYTTVSKDNRGSYIINIGDKTLKVTVEPTPNENQSATVKLGRVKLAAGEFEVAVKPTDIQGGELMRLFHVSLIPVDVKSALRVFLLNDEQLQTTKQRILEGDKSVVPALNKLESDAKNALTVGTFSVVSKEPVPPSGDKHNYMSQAPYFWADPKSPNGLPYIRRDGERNPEINKISDHKSMDDMVRAVETLALAYYFKGDEAHAAKAVQLLRAWFLDSATKMNPSLQYAQFIPGVNTGRGIGLIETRGLTRIVDAVGLLEGSKTLTEQDKRGLQDWFAKFLQWMLESKHGRDEAAAKNNHGTYYDLQTASFALFLGKKDLAAKILQEAKEKRIAVQIEPDGRQPLELVRTKAWSYSIGNLDGLMQLATLGENVGVDLWNYQTKDGCGIRKALNYLMPFALGEKWLYQQLGEWQPQALFPLIRRAANKYQDKQIQAMIAKIPNVDSADRSVLLRPKTDERTQAQK